MLKVRNVFIRLIVLVGLSCTPLFAQDNIMTNSGTWFTSGNWSLGHEPTGPENAVINTNVVVSYTAGTPNYTGNLVLREGAQFDFGLLSGSSIQAYFPSDRSSEVHCYDGSKIELRDGDGSATNTIVLYGDFTLQRLSSVSVTMYITSPIRGAGHLTLQPNIAPNYTVRRIVINNVSPSTYTGGTTIEPHPGDPNKETYLGVTANDAFGTGDVTIDGTASAYTVTLRFEGSTTNVIDDGASLYLVGNAILNLQARTETVKKLFIDGEPQVVGTWGPSTSAADNTNDTYFKGTTGILTVLDTDIPPAGTVIIVR